MHGPINISSVIYENRTKKDKQIHKAETGAVRKWLHVFSYKFLFPNSNKISGLQRHTYLWQLHITSDKTTVRRSFSR